MVRFCVRFLGGCSYRCFVKSNAPHVVLCGALLFTSFSGRVMLGK